MLRINTPKHTEAALVERMKAGDRAAFAEAMRLHGGVMLACARRICGQSAEDAVQEAWIDVFNGIANFAGRSSLKTWLVRIAMNKSFDLVRRQQRLVSVDIDAHDPFEGAFSDDGHWRERFTPWHHDTPEALLSAHVLAECLEKHLSAMPQAQQIAIQLVDIGQLPPEDVAEQLGMQMGNLRVTLHRGRMRLFNMVNHYEKTGDC